MWRLLSLLVIARAWGLEGALGAAFRATSSALVGVSVSPRGFVALVASPSRIYPVVLARADTERVVSAEAHTVLQLLQGIDMATAVLPPDALQRAFANDNVELSRVVLGLVKESRTEATESTIAGETPGTCSAARAASRAPALSAAMARLGLVVSVEESAELLKRFADEDGELTRYAFSLALEAARRAAEPPRTVAARLVATDGRSVEASAFVAVALALRYDSCVECEAALFDEAEAIEATEVPATFPLMRSVEEIQLDGAQIEAHSRRMFADAARRVQGEG